MSELETDITGKTILLADRADGEVLDSKAGPLQIIVPDEKLHARWIRQVTAINVYRAADGSKKKL